MQRQRVFIYARRSNVRIFGGCPQLLGAEQMMQEALEPWNAAARPALRTWLQRSHDLAEIERLKELGNVVLPRCARLAVHFWGNLEKQSSA